MFLKVAPYISYIVLTIEVIILTILLHNFNKISFKKNLVKAQIKIYLALVWLFKWGTYSLNFS